MKFKKLPVLLVAIMALGFVFTSCEKEELKTENSENINEQVTINDLPNLKVEDGMLCFENEDDYFEILNKLNMLDVDKYIDWANLINFTSFEMMYNDFSKELSDSNKEISKKYEEIFTIKKTDDNDEYYVMNIVDPFYSRILNSEGCVKIGETVYKLTKEYCEIKIQNKNNKILFNNLSKDELDKIPVLLKSEYIYWDDSYYSLFNGMDGKKYKYWIQLKSYRDQNYNYYAYSHIDTYKKSWGKYRPHSWNWEKITFVYKNTEGRTRTATLWNRTFFSHSWTHIVSSSKVKEASIKGETIWYYNQNPIPEIYREHQ